MSSRSRYLLLLVGFLFFLIAAPILILYVTGQTYDFKTGRFVKTGILSLKSEPKSAKVYVDGKLVQNSAGDIKLVPKGEYQITLSKEGYFDWNKRLAVNPGEVTWVSPVGSKLYLFLKNGKSKNLASGALDFLINGNAVYYVDEHSLVKTSVSNPETSQNFTLPLAVDTIKLSPDGKTILLTESSNKDTGLVFDLSENQFHNLNPLISSPDKLDFSGSGELFSLEKGNLFRVDAKTRQKTKILSQVGAFSFLDRTLYYIKTDPSGNSLVAASSPYTSGTEVFAKIPEFTSGNIIANFEKQIFLILDGSLYRVTSTLDQLASGISEWDFNLGESTITIIHNGELSYYNPYQRTINFIDRTSLPQVSPKTSLAYNNVFVVRGNQVLADELDTRDHQNEYSFYTGKKITKLTVGEEAKTLFVLDDGNLIQLEIRK